MANMNSVETIDYDALKRMDTSIGSATYAHNTVKSAYRLVQGLEDIWHNIRTDSSDEETEPHEIKHIETLIRLIGQSKPLIIDRRRVVEIFRYFASAVCYSGAIFYSTLAKNPQKTVTISERLLEASILLDEESAQKTQVKFDENLSQKINLSTLDEIARRIVEEINSCSGIKDPFVKAKVTANGQIPFLQVASSEHYHVLIRNGLELARSQRSFSRQVKTGREELDHFPVLIYRSGQQSSNLKIPESLEELIPDKSSREKLLKGKWITWIQIFLADYESTKTQIEIDVMDYPLVADPKFVHIPSKNLIDITGRERAKWNSKTNNSYVQEEIIITYFSNILFDYWLEDYANKSSIDLDYKQSTVLWQNVQDWCDSCIQSYAVNLFKTKMYIGFSWGSVIDGGYGDRTTVCGARNLLLLSFARGLVKLSQNSSRTQEFMSRESIEHFENLKGFSSSNGKSWKFNIPMPSKIVSSQRLSFAKKKYKEKINRKISKPYGLVFRNKLRELEFSANSSGITVKSKPRVFVIIVMLCGLLVFIAYCIGLGFRQKTANNYEEYIGGMMSLPPLLAAICLFVIKLRFPKWEIMDIVNGRMFTESFQDLVNVLPTGRKGAISIVASVDNPKEVMKGRGSNSFVVNGEGNFEIDELFTVRELQQAGFLFGIDYHGKTVCVNSQGVTRRILFPENVDKEHLKLDPHRGMSYFCDTDDEKNEFEFTDEEEPEFGINNDKNALRILTEHEIQPAIIFKISVTEMLVR